MDRFIRNQRKVPAISIDEHMSCFYFHIFLLSTIIFNALSAILGSSSITAFILSAIQRLNNSSLSICKISESNITCSFLARRSPRSIRLYIGISISKAIANCFCSNPFSTLAILILWAKNIRIQQICHYLANILLLFDLNIKRLQRKEKIRALLYSCLIYTFIKVKSNKGKKGDGYAKTYWLQPFFFWL